VRRTPIDQPVAFVEIPKGSRNKYEYDDRLGRVVLDRSLYSSVVYPCDYGFLLDTLADDGDPLDALVLVQEPTFSGCLIPCDLVGVFEMRDEAGLDDKVLCVPHNDPTWSQVTDVSQVSAMLRQEIGHFFEIYKDLEPGKHVTIGGWRGHDDAVALWERGRAAWQDRAAAVT
jgi:inorganic pyrophosphatase